MTATTVLAPSVACPTWCTVTTPERHCEGEHRADVGDYLPATAGLPRIASYAAGVTFPAIGVSLGWNRVDDLEPCISLHITGENIDEQPDLHLREARELLANPGRAIQILEAELW